MGLDEIHLVQERDKEHSVPVICGQFLEVQKNRLKRSRFMRHLIYSVRYSVVPTNYSLLTITLQSSVRKTIVYNYTRYSVPFMTL